MCLHKCLLTRDTLQLVITLPCGVNSARQAHFPLAALEKEMLLCSVTFWLQYSFICVLYSDVGLLWSSMFTLILLRTLTSDWQCLYRVRHRVMSVTRQLWGRPFQGWCVKWHWDRRPTFNFELNVDLDLSSERYSERMSNFELARY